MYLSARIHKEAIYFIPYLDGQELKNCLAASEAGGWATCYMFDIFGEAIEDWASNEILKIIKYGKIKLVDSRISNRIGDKQVIEMI